MTKSGKSTLVAAAVAGLLSAIPATSVAMGNGHSALAGSAASFGQKTDKPKHACKGQNACKGQGADGKNSCKGKGSCATDGSKPPMPKSLM